MVRMERKTNSRQKSEFFHCELEKESMIICVDTICVDMLVFDDTFTASEIPEMWKSC